MKYNKKLFYISLAISIVTIIVAWIVHNASNDDNISFWIDILIGIFGGSILTTFSSLLGYFDAKRTTLENFQYHTLQLVFLLSKYRESESLKNKVDYFIQYNEFDKIAWDSDFGNIDFFFNKNRDYIYSTIYKPLLDVNKCVSSHYFDFLEYKNSNSHNDEVINTYLKDIEVKLIKTIEFSKEFEVEGKKLSNTSIKTVTPILSINIRKELNGRYYEIMTGKRIKDKTEEKEDGKDK